ncbi:GDP-D-glucose phosphorylase 1 [Ditylenchus destructor]|uniref:GDP-D-glucose phosphorylase 1 n=1 Tax=Ditylenchus destructor TaxID=166010 RepID=A0AAD4RA75_9BILA|nr:GDP-D-glucose phosphorylase 1 [Ditylenchus destructor]
MEMSLSPGMDTKPGSNLRAYRSLSTVQAPTELQIMDQGFHKAAPFLQYRTNDFIYDLRKCQEERKEHDFKQKLVSKWEEARERKVFNYDLKCMYKLLEGNYNLSLQLNVERGTLRRKPMRFQNIRQPFNHLRWNFTKLRQAELLYLLRCGDKPYTADKLDIHTIAVNASPMEKGHSLVIPSVNKCFPQVLNSSAVRISTDLMLLTEDENFHVLFNSLLGQASVNHLHTHILFWPYESDLINRPVEPLFPNKPSEDSPMFILRRPAWLIQTFVFQLKSPASFDAFVNNITNCAIFLTEQNVAHNLFMSRAPPLRTTSLSPTDCSVSIAAEPLYVTAYLFPRRNQTGAKPPTNFSPASMELAGFLTAYTYRFFETATESTVIRIIDEDAVLSDMIFETLVQGLAERFEGQVPWSCSEDETISSNGEGKRRTVSTGLLSPCGSFRYNLGDRRRWSHSVSERLGISSSGDESDGGARPGTAGDLLLSGDEYLDLAGLTSHEIDELVDDFHTITTPIPLPHQHSHSNTSSCSGSPIVGGFHTSNNTTAASKSRENTIENATTETGNDVPKAAMMNNTGW